MFKRFLLVVSSGLLKITLFSLALAGAGWMVFGMPDKIKQAVDESGLYNSAVDGALESAKKQALQDNEQLPLDQPEIQAAAENAFPPELLSKNSESIINGFYGWLKGDTAEPAFSVDLGEAKQRFADGVADYAQKRYESLPPCNFAQLQALNPDVDPFKVDCRPPGLLGDAVREQVRSEIINSDEFLENTAFTADDLPKDQNGRAVTENLSAAPDAYNAFRSLPWILGVASVVLGAGVLLLSEDKRRGLKRIGVTLVGTGIFLGLGSLLIGYLFNQMNQPADAFQASVASIAKSLVGDYNAALMRFYLTYIILGAIILLALWYQNRNNTIQMPKPAQK